MSREFKFEAVIIFDEDHDMPTEDDLDLGALYYGDKNMPWSVYVVPGTIEEIKK